MSELYPVLPCYHW